MLQSSQTKNPSHCIYCIFASTVESLGADVPVATQYCMAPPCCSVLYTMLRGTWLIACTLRTIMYMWKLRACFSSSPLQIEFSQNPSALSMHPVAKVEVGAPVSIVNPSCHHYWLFSGSNPRITACKPCILATNPWLLPNRSSQVLEKKFGDIKTCR